MPHNTFNTLDSFKLGNGKSAQFYSLPKLEKAGIGKISRLPVSIRIVLESVLRNVDGREDRRKRRPHAGRLAAERRAHRRDPVHGRARPAAGFHGRAAARRSRRDAQRGVADEEGSAKIIEPLVPVDLVVDHSVQVDFLEPSRRAADEHGHRVQAQPAALSVPEVGDAGVQRIPASCRRESGSCTRSISNTSRAA